MPLEQRRGVKGGTSSGRARRLCYRRAWRVVYCGERRGILLCDERIVSVLWACYYIHAVSKYKRNHTHAHVTSICYSCCCARRSGSGLSRAHGAGRAALPCRSRARRVHHHAAVSVTASGASSSAAAARDDRRAAEAAALYTNRSPLDDRVAAVAYPAVGAAAHDRRDTAAVEAAARGCRTSVAAAVVLACRNRRAENSRHGRRDTVAAAAGLAGRARNLYRARRVEVASRWR